MTAAAGTTGTRSWLRVNGPADPRLTVVCLPHAGAGATSFARWQAAFDPDVRLARVRLPGREDAPHEAPLRRVHQAVDVTVRVGKPTLVLLDQALEQA